ncbi:MAG: CDP-alcohol phosphatidyltransferase family protein [Burkholderiales bacterium]
MSERPMEIGLRLARWSEMHALVALGGTALVLGGAPLWTLMLLASVSFAGLVWGCRDAWPRPGRFGSANALTTARLLGAIALPAVAALGPLAVAAWALTLFALDGVDGWLARRLGLASEFGEYFDKEADAFFMLALCVLLHTGERLGAWIVVPGLLRYGFVVFLMLAKPHALKERRSATGRWIYFGMISALIAAFTPFRNFYEPYALVMTLALTYSFAEALRDLYRRPQAARKA